MVTGLWALLCSLLRATMSVKRGAHRRRSRSSWCLLFCRYSKQTKLCFGASVAAHFTIYRSRLLTEGEAFIEFTAHIKTQFIVL